MGVANTKSTAITNLDATPPQLTNRALCGGPYLVAVGICEVAAADDNGSVYRFVRLPSNAVVHEILVKNDAITGGTAYDVGIYHTAENGGAAVDDDLFASAVDISAGNTTWLDVRGEAATTAVIDHMERPLWYILDLGAATLPSDPNLQYDLCLTGDTVGTGAGTILVRVMYSV